MLHGGGTAWTWEVSGRDGTAAGRTDSCPSAVAWVCRVLATAGDADAVIEHPDLDEPLRLTSRGGVVHADLGWTKTDQ